jgi:hypothetical protein
LNTDWYADGLKRPAFGSAPVNFSMTPDKYKQGTRDYVVYYENPDLAQRYGINGTDYYNLSSIINFMSDEKDPMGAVQTQGGESLRYYPTKRFFLKVDKGACLKNGVVRAEDAPLMVDSIKWEIGNQTLMKADLILLDIIASNINTRPIYWAITTGSDVYLNLQPYFQLEGLTYRLVPILNTFTQDGNTGRINTAILYDHLMNKFKWGNMEAEGVYLDETILRQTKNFRNIFFRLSEALTMEGKKDSAVKVIDYCLKVLPKDQVQYDVFVVRLIEAYYAAGAKDKAVALSKDLFSFFEERAKYFLTFKEKRGQVKPELEDHMQIMNYLVQMAEFNQQKALNEELKTRLGKLQSGQ